MITLRPEAEAARRVRLALSAGVTFACLLSQIGSQAAESDAAVAAYLQAWNGAPARLEAALASDFADRTSLLPLDANAFREHLHAWRRAIPDLKVTVLERVTAPDREVLRLRYEGRPADAALLPLSPGSIAIEQTDWLTMRGGKIAGRQATPDDWSVPVELLFVPPPVSPIEPLPAQTIAQLGPMTFLESIAVAQDGRLFVSTGRNGGIVTIDARGAVQPFAKLDVGQGGFMMCLTFDEHGALFATVNSSTPAVHGVWRFNDDGTATRLAALPLSAAPNGLALDGRGALLIADSFGGAIWRVPLAGGPARIWLRHHLLAPRPLLGRFPGANGVQRMGDAILVAVSDRSLLLRIGIAPDGSPGEPEIFASSIPGDDFAIARDGSVYVATHPFNTVVRLTPDGRRSIVAGPAQGVIGPTSVAIGADGALYVANDGGLFRPLPGVAPIASVVRLQPPAHTAP